MKDFLSPRARGIQPYIPGEQPKDRRYIKLNTNENPYPPSPRVIEAIARVNNGDLKLYTLPEMEGVRAAAAKVEGLPGIEWAYCGNGSDEVLSLAFQAFFGGDLPLLFPDVTYSFYPVYCELYGIRFETAPLTEDFRIRLSDYSRPACGAVFPNPNAPTGVFIPVREIEAYLDKHEDRLLLLDEAYVRFGGETASGLVKSHPNLAIVRTLSKSHALAGLRCGLIFAQPQLIKGIVRVKNSFNSYPMSALNQAGAEAAILDDAYSREICAKVAATREHVRKELARMGFACTPSLANLLFFSHPKLAGERLFGGLRDRGVLVRYFSKPERIKDYVRMSIGTDGDMDKVIQALADILKAQS